MKAIQTLVISLLSCLALSRLILPSHLPEIIEKNAKSRRPELRDLNAPLSAASTADPVQGIQNATSGYLSVDDPNTASKLFYVFYSCRGLKSGQTPKDVPVIIWLQGGPGGSSFMGGFTEFGPYRLEKDKSTGQYKEVRNDRSWNDYYNLMIVDNPRGTGYSVADGNSYVHSEDEVAEDFLNALLNFYQLEAFSPFEKTPLYVFGESYGGHYVPSVSKKILEYNAKAEKKIPFAGMGIGDGWTDPIHQMYDFSNFAFSLGFLDYNEKHQAQQSQLLGIGNILNGGYMKAFYNFQDTLELTMNASGGINIYNFREFDKYDWSELNDFFNNKENAKRYNIDPRYIGTYCWECEEVFNGLANEFMQSFADRVAYVADSGLPVLLYNGQYDVIVHTPCALNWIRELRWGGQMGFYNAPFQNWIYNNGSVVGYAKNYKNFTFVVVNKAGHFLPTDQLEPSIEMIRRFTSGNNQWNRIF